MAIALRIAVGEYASFFNSIEYIPGKFQAIKIPGGLLQYAQMQTEIRLMLRLGSVLETILHPIHSTPNKLLTEDTKQASYFISSRYVNGIA